MEGQLSQLPLAELIREIIGNGSSGALRLARDAAKVVVYFDKGELVFASSNMRAHRLRSVLQRNGFSGQADALAAGNSDEELAAALLKRGYITATALQEIRTHQVGDVLRTALLWTNGNWQFDQQVRIQTEIRVAVDVDQFLLECARHLPFAFIKLRIENDDVGYVVAPRKKSINLLPVEASMLSQASAAEAVFQLGDILTNGDSEPDAMRSIYALSLAGVLRRIRPRLNLKVKQVKVDVARTKTDRPDQTPDVDNLFARLSLANDYYDVLGVASGATPNEIKDAYHQLARSFHPDRFHQSTTELRQRIESAFARIAQSYETLSDARKRQLYDQRKLGKPEANVTQKTVRKEPAPAASKSNNSRAESSFVNGMKAFERNQLDDAVRLLGEAATLEPRDGRYRCQYGRALMHRANNRRLAETELQAAVALEPDNAAFRVVLAEFYQRIGLRRRAESEAARALTSDPANQAARALLTTLAT